MVSPWWVSMLWLLAQAGAVQGVPAGAAENARVVPPPAARPPLPADRQMDPAALVAAVRADALRQAGPGGRVADVQPPQAVVWNDGALGCPQPGLSYTQALVPGWRIVVHLGDGRRLDYHASHSGAWLRCASAQPEPVAPAASR